VYYEGQIWRPPSEAASLIVQATVGCSQNSCRFCSMYKAKTFRCRPAAEVIADLEAVRESLPGVRRIFLADGDALAMPAEELEAILEAIAGLFPYCRRVTCYASPKSIARKTDDELAALRARNLQMVYLGLESGDDAVLKAVTKGATAAQIIAAGKRVRRAGITLSVTAISGLGGVPRWQEHALGTAAALSAMNPEYIGLLTLNLQPGTPLYADWQDGRFQTLTPLQAAAETRLLLEHLDSPGSVLRANHSSNYVNLAGTLNADTPALIARLDAAMEGQIPFRPEERRGL
jgi:radical SAM superfamily enzyme YgiQ (UPF0313 family)